VGEGPPQAVSTRDNVPNARNRRVLVRFQADDPRRIDQIDQEPVGPIPPVLPPEPKAPKKEQQAPKKEPQAPKEEPQAPKEEPQWALVLSAAGPVNFHFTLVGPPSPTDFNFQVLAGANRPLHDEDEAGLEVQPLAQCGLSVPVKIGPTGAVTIGPTSVLAGFQLTRVWKARFDKILQPAVFFQILGGISIATNRTISPQAQPSVGGQLTFKITPPLQAGAQLSAGFTIGPNSVTLDVGAGAFLQLTFP
jgi:hypothetical protein